jgi:hypothetical protein
MRLRSRVKPARPYICLLIIVVRFRLARPGRGGVPGLRRVVVAGAQRVSPPGPGSPSAIRNCLDTVSLSLVAECDARENSGGPGRLVCYVPGAVSLGAPAESGGPAV